MIYKQPFLNLLILSRESYYLNHLGRYRTFILPEGNLELCKTTIDLIFITLLGLHFMWIQTDCNSSTLGYLKFIMKGPFPWPTRFAMWNTLSSIKLISLRQLTISISPSLTDCYLKFNFSEFTKCGVYQTPFKSIELVVFINVIHPSNLDISTFYNSYSFV